MHEICIRKSNARAGNVVRKLRSGEEKFLERWASPTGQCVIAQQRMGAMKTIVHCSTWDSKEMNCVQLKWRTGRCSIGTTPLDGNLRHLYIDWGIVRCQHWFSSWMGQSQLVTLAAYFCCFIRSCRQEVGQEGFGKYIKLTLVGCR